MTTIIPLNGTGQRFKDAGYKVPKHLLPVGQEMLLDRVLRCVGGISDRIVLLCREEYLKSTREVVDDSVKIIGIPRDTSGPLDTVLCAEAILLPQDDILVADCDSFFRDTVELHKAVEGWRNSSASGAVTTMPSDDLKVTYVKTQREEVREFREHDPFTNISATGPYWFRRWDLILKYGRLALTDGHTSVASVYNYMIKDGLMVKATQVKTFVHLGTPEAYEKNK